MTQTPDSAYPAEPLQPSPEAAPQQSTFAAPAPYGPATLPPAAPGTGWADSPPSPAARSRRGLVTAVAAACLVSGAAGGFVGAGLTGEDESPALRSTGGAADVRTASTVDGTVSSAASVITPSTVVIEVTGSAGGRFGRQQVGGSGSGVVLDTEGSILTNAHVVTAGGSVSDPAIQVVFADGTTAEATVVGIDESSDLAVIDIDGVSDLVPASFADSDDLVIGQTVVAVGAPLGLAGTVTEGIVSAVDRPVRTGSSQDVSTVLDAVQTDAAINPGNSGGPLVDLAGSVVGINSAIATVSAAGGESGNIGVGFAIPSNDAMNIAEQLLADGTAEHASLGVNVSETEDGSAGAVIRSVEARSAAADAGLRDGDVVLAVGERRVLDLDGLLAAIRDYQPGDEVAITVQREDDEEEITVTLGSRTG